MDGPKLVTVHVNSASRLSTTPTMRICRMVSSVLGTPLVHDVESAEIVLAAPEYQSIDWLLLKPGVLKFSAQRQQVLQLVDRSKRVLLLENDYAFKTDPRIMGGRPFDRTWSTCVEPDSVNYVNWNVLTMTYPRPWLPAEPFCEQVIPKLLYYGALRPGRVELFRHYFGDVGEDEVTISSHRGDFWSINPRLYVIGKLTPELLAHYQASLYIEDQFSHFNFTSPANRFYECLQAGVAILFDASSLASLRRAGIDASDFAVGSMDDVSRKRPHFNNIRIEQRRLWHRDYYLELQTRLEALGAAL